ncbi:hypothetical protein H257_18161 [Aphanomyces astaci]|uniref:Uncharacterized protein n=1 Tax=Aphanomyces astaci TaxID=112090 RepID=W4FC33_APHAT|nr:hypothetical protein H257_18161 [Aphanomyces astaci]ETV65037.1 hypothetical protein H257_18161 [Aphanomyces astaci]|eukprot:XP_009845473.1 hypothetical protein H257_18161 [Aphanomyces astaci]
MVQSVAVKKTTKDAALLSMQRKPTKLYETSGNSEEITHAHRVDTSSRNEVQRCGPRRPRSPSDEALDSHLAELTAACCALFASSQHTWLGRQEHLLQAVQGEGTQSEDASEANEEAPTAHQGRWRALDAANSVLEVQYCPDTGADQNIMPQAMVDKLQVLQPHFK